MLVYYRRYKNTAVYDSDQLQTVGRPDPPEAAPQTLCELRELPLPLPRVPMLHRRWRLLENPSAKTQKSEKGGVKMNRNRYTQAPFGCILTSGFAKKEEAENGKARIYKAPGHGTRISGERLFIP